jgi:hypothetical protein
MYSISNSLKVQAFRDTTGTGEATAIAYLCAEQWDIYDALASYKADQQAIQDKADIKYLRACERAALNTAFYVGQ